MIPIGAKRFTSTTKPKVGDGIYCKYTDKIGTILNFDVHKSKVKYIFPHWEKGQGPRTLYLVDLIRAEAYLVQKPTSYKQIFMAKLLS